MLPFGFDNTYARELQGFHVPWKPASVPEPRLLYLNRPLAAELGLDPAALATPDGAALFAGNTLPEGAEPIAQAYAGHQFGGFSPQLGDGRALLLGELVDVQGRRRDIALKGSGRTPFSRGGDGKAAVGPMLREVLIGEAMHALGIPTTRALAVAATGEPVYREQPLPGAVLTRVAASHLRVGTFQFFAARGDVEKLRQLADYTIARHYPDLKSGQASDPASSPVSNPVSSPASNPASDPAPNAAASNRRYLALLREVARRQASLIAQWMNVGFIHGVMNTDNMTISGETIDYGPCAFMEAYDPEAVFSSIDHGGRYAYGNQPHIAGWNLARFAEALLPLMADAENEEEVNAAVAQVMAVIDAFPGWYEDALRRGQRAKLGLQASEAEDAALAEDWLNLLHTQAVDFTLAWRRLADAAQGDDAPLRVLFAEPAALEPWLQRWRERCSREDQSSTVAESQRPTVRATAMRQVNPWIIARNHRVEEALAAASNTGDLQPFEQLLAALQRPFDEAPELAAYAEPAPMEVTACYRTFCGT